MNLGENLISLRKKENMSQEDLAEKLDVSRQAISKWESGQGYPEMEKIIKISEIFNYNIDLLIKGKVDENQINDIEKYDNFMKKIGKNISIALFLILLGVTLLLLYIGHNPNIKNLTEKEITIGVVLLLIFVLLSLPIFIISGLNMDSFKKKNPKITSYYNEKEIEKFDKKFGIILAGSISLILIGVIQLLLMIGLKTYENELTSVGLFMIYITITVPIITYYGIQKDKYDLNKYNKTNNIELKKETELIGKISAVIMLTSTIIYFILGFIFNLWKYNWMLFPIGGMICGIFAIILNKEE